MRMNHYFFKKALFEMGFRSLGEHVLISRTCQIYSPEKISIGDNVLIDDFTIMSGNIEVGSHVHISSNCELYTGENSSILIGDYAGIASHSSVYAQTDDYVGPYMSNPTIPAQFRNLIEQDIVLDKHVVIGTHSVVLPGVHLGEGCSFGANSVINKSTPPGGVYIGAPIKWIRAREIDGIQRKEWELVEEKQRRTSKMKEK